MRNKFLVIATGIFTFAALIVVLFDSDGPVKKDAPNSIIKYQDLQQVTELKITSSSSTTTIVKNEDNLWTFKEDGFPVNAQKVIGFFDSLDTIKVEREISSEGEDLVELGLENGTRFELSSPTQSHLQLTLGNKRPRGGMYVALGNDKSKIYLLNNPINIQVDKKGWENTTLLKLNSEDITKITLNKGTVDEAIFEKKDGKLTLTQVEGGTEVDTSKVNTVANLLQNIRFSNRQTNKSFAKVKNREPSLKAEAILTNREAISMEIIPQNDGEKKKWYLKLSIPDSSSNKTLVAMSKNNVFEIPSYNAEKLARGKKDFLKEKKKG